MSYLLRKIKGSRWAFTKPDNESEFPADPLADLNTLTNSLSLYLIENKRRDLKKIIVGIATTRENIESMGYALIKITDMEKTGFKVIENLGDTPYAEVNILHRELKDLTAERLIELAKLIHKKAHKSTFFKAEINKFITNALKRKKLEVSRMTKGMRKKFSIDP